MTDSDGREFSDRELMSLEEALAVAGIKEDVVVSYRTAAPGWIVYVRETGSGTQTWHISALTGRRTLI